MTFVPHCVIKEAMKRKHFINLANRNELSGDDVPVREDVQPDSMTSYGESMPCIDQEPQAVALTAVCESGSYTNTP